MKTELTPLISVVMASYNGSRFIEKQIQSILDQDYTYIELIIVDDASTDDTVSKIQAFAALDTRIHFHKNEHNLGYIKTFEKGLRLSKGDFVALSDQDDIWATNKLSCLLSEIQDHPIVFSDSQLIDDDDQWMSKKLSDIKQLRNIPSCLCYGIGGSAPGHAMLIQQNIIQQCFPFPEIFPHDYWLAFIAATKGTIKYIPLPLNFYRQHNHNVFGAGNRKKSTKQKPGRSALREIRYERISLLANTCPDDLPEKAILHQLAASYKSYSFFTNIKRMQLFFTHQDELLSFKKRSAFRKFLFCLKTFYIAP